MLHDRPFLTPADRDRRVGVGLSCCATPPSWESSPRFCWALIWATRLLSAARVRRCRWCCSPGGLQSFVRRRVVWRSSWLLTGRRSGHFTVAQPTTRVIGIAQNETGSKPREYLGGEVKTPRMQRSLMDDAETRSSTYWMRSGTAVAARRFCALGPSNRWSLGLRSPSQAKGRAD